METLMYNLWLALAALEEEMRRHHQNYAGY